MHLLPYFEKEGHIVASVEWYVSQSVDQVLYAQYQSPLLDR